MERHRLSTVGDASLAGEVAIVTGSTGRGTGTQVAEVLGRLGARVVVTGRSSDVGELVAERIRSGGGEAIFTRADVQEREQCKALVRSAVDTFGALTILINCAVATEGGQQLSAQDGGGEGSVGTVTDEAWNRTLLVNLTAVMWLCRYALPEMIASGHGSVVNIGSRAAERGTPSIAAYTAAKGGLHALTRSIAMDYAVHNIRANTVAPGYIVSKDRDAPLEDVELMWVRGMHLTSPPTTLDVAYAAAYLASPAAAAITGHTLMVDGGGSIGRAASLG